MPGAYLIDRARSLVMSRAWGVVTATELKRHARALCSDPGFEPHFHQLADMREVTEFRANAGAIRDMAALQPFRVGSRSALVVVIDLVFGMSRMYQILTERSPDEFEVFRDFDQAYKWLGVAGEKSDLLRALAEAPALADTD